ncbi:hypothetical protein L0F63_003236 [Massospora cicadina]|nr:hypothetical protein L0F63_003236 [Massospora cicadina]
MGSTTALKRLELIQASFTPAGDRRGSVSRTELTPVSFLRRSATIFPDRVAALSEADPISYTQFQGRVLSLAASLKTNYAIGVGDRVGLVCRNSPLMLDAHFAIPCLRGIIVAINTRLSHEDVAYIAEHAGCKLIIYDVEFEPLLKSVSVACVSVDDFRYTEDAKLGWDDFPYDEGIRGRRDLHLVHFRDDGKAERGDGHLPRRGPGLPKQRYRDGLDERLALLMGAPNVPLQRVEFSVVRRGGGWGKRPSAATRARRRFATIRLLPPPAESRRHGCRVSTFPALLANMVALGLHPIHTYGLTETYGPSTAVYTPHAADPATRYRLMARQGHAYMMADPVRVVDPQMHDFSGEPGVPGGWFHTGDLAVMEEDGAITIHDRKKDIIISGGENISTIEIEKALASHPAIREVAVVSSPHPKWGETPKAFIVLTTEASSRDPAALKSEMFAYARDHLAHFKCPTQISFLRELPKTGTGKIQKFVLKRQEWASEK